MSFTDRLAFLRHQIGEYHEGVDSASMIASLEMEWVDPHDGQVPVGLPLAGESSREVRVQGCIEFT